MTGTTPNFGIEFEDDYDQPADYPAAAEAMANSVDSGVGARQIIAGAGLTGGGSLSADRTINVAAGRGLAVDADALSLADQATYTADWNSITGSGFYQCNGGAANSPTGSGNWLGWAIVYDSSWQVQFAMPFNIWAQSYGVQYSRTKVNGGWTAWARTANYLTSNGTNPNYIYLRHGGSSQTPTPGVDRFTMGLAKDANDLADTWRLRTHDTLGAYNNTAMYANVIGICYFPQNLAAVETALAGGEPVARDTAVTVGAVLDLVTALLEGHGITVDPQVVAAVLPTVAPAVHADDQGE